MHDIPSKIKYAMLDIMDIINSEYWEHDVYGNKEPQGRWTHFGLLHCCDLHPTELMCAQVKHRVGMNNSGFKIYEMERLTRKGSTNVTMFNLNSLCNI
jgi:hypothetical protein